MYLQSESMRTEVSDSMVDETKRIQQYKLTSDTVRPNEKEGIILALTLFLKRNQRIPTPHFENSQFANND